MITEQIYGERFAELARRAACVGAYIAVEDTKEGDAGPYVLRCVETGYDAHIDGCNLELIEFQLRQIEVEDQLKKRITSYLDYGMPADEAKQAALNDIRPEVRARLEEDYKLDKIAEDALINALPEAA